MSTQSASSASRDSAVGLIPDDWSVSTLGELSSMTTVGFVGSMSHLFQPRGVPLLRGTNILSGDLDLQDLRYISEKTHRAWSKSSLRHGDIVMVRVGYPGTAAVVPPDLGEANAASLVITRPDPKRLNAHFAMQVINSPDGRSRVQAGLVGGAQQVFNTTLAARFPIPVPPRQEQERIAEALSDADNLARGYERLIAKKRAMKQGMMHELLSGGTRLPGFTLPWRRGTFEDLAVPARDRTTPTAVAPQTLLVELEHVESGTGRLVSRANASSAVSAKTVFRKGDVLFGKLRAYLRKFWLADSRGLCTTEIWALRSKPGSLGGFVRYVVETEGFIEIASGAHGTHMPRSDWGVVRNLEIDIPPTEEQAAIASVLCKADTEIDKLHARLAKARAIKDGMMQQLLTGRTRLSAGEDAS